jgi:hypothetical protein
VAAEYVASVRLDRPADASESFAAGFSSTDLTARSGCPNHAAQVVDFHNASTSTQNAVYVTHRGKTVTVPLAAGQRYSSPCPVSTLSASGANVSAVAHWWLAPGASYNA